MRRILHVDIDAFFASVEEIDDPTLKGKPIIVGGTGERGVVATASYEARKYGVHSAMSTQMARNLCPKGIFLKGRHDRYSEVSRQVFDILETVTESIEKVSIDEAYLDITNKEESSVYIAMEVKKQVKKYTGLTISIGISYNKFLAKLASDWNKPNGIFEIQETDIPQLLKPLSILKVHGLGKKTALKLNRIGIFTIEDLLKYPLDNLRPLLGELRAIEIYDKIRGIDNREISTNRERKSYGKETTFSMDLQDKGYIMEILKEFSCEIVEHLKEQGKSARTVTVKIKYEDFEQITRSHSLEYHTSDIRTIFDIINKIVNSIDLSKKVRLAGISLSNITHHQQMQLDLFNYF
ncbi:DNA polymerase IV [Alkaliphilus peptidifermentans]|uniref:DNA polymerase IV n=1 Tax=Alkaliphilus peptidifermentans DSM 18978 TaxID=1120976 RepID=A0A1G5K863_9FIRM|nr:DNA polymerase IV [Alkaliphilus peptidifermentans]SCY96441.1 DNA polymerase-4 [Alkaliphilus peptidifermentans DSM 18978]